MIVAEQKARVTYDNILRLAKDDPDVTDVIRFLREREIVHFQRFAAPSSRCGSSWTRRTSITPTLPSTNNPRRTKHAPPQPALWGQRGGRLSWDGVQGTMATLMTPSRWCAKRS